MESSYLNEREGGDITASDMIEPEEDSDIIQFYRGSTIFLTGATGFLGKLCLEKLLRTCHDLNKIYILIRTKKGKDTQKRFEELFDDPSFDPLKRKYPNFIRKVHIINGDVSLPNLGINDDDMDTLIAEVDCVIHYAATVNFDEKIRTATYINVRGVRDLLRLAKKMKRLRAFLHVSTAYSNCTRNDISEEFYEPPITGEKLISLVDDLDEDKLNAMTPILLGDFPNTYTFTKCVAEDVLRTEGKSLPVALYRPSIVIATSKEPVAGWINNIYGPTGVLIGSALGFLRVLHSRSDYNADMVPADYVINSCLAVIWDVASIKTLNQNKEVQDMKSREEQFEQQIPIYNFVATPEKPLTWSEYKRLSVKHCVTIPSEKCLWHSMLILMPYKFLVPIIIFVLHTLPAYLIDIMALTVGKKPMLAKKYEKINKFIYLSAFFSTRQWSFKNTNIQDLWSRLKKQDKQLFEFSMKNIDWDLYFYTYTRGCRVYILKDPLDTIPQGVIKYYKLFAAHYLLCGVVIFLFYKFFMLVFGLFL